MTREDELQAELEAMLDPMDYPGAWTLRERATYEDRRRHLTAHLQEVRQHTRALAEADAQLARLTGWHTFLQTARQTLAHDVFAIKSPIRDRDVRERADQLIFAIRLIDRGLGGRLPIVTLAPTPLGPLMTEAGYAVAGPDLRGPNGWLGSLPEVESNLKDLTTARTSAQRALDAAWRALDAVPVLSAT